MIFIGDKQLKRKKAIVIVGTILIIGIIRLNYKDDNKAEISSKSIQGLPLKNRPVGQTDKTESKLDINIKIPFDSASNQSKISSLSDDKPKIKYSALNPKYKVRLEEKVKSYLVNPDKMKVWQASRSSFVALLGNIMNDTKKLEASLETNLIILQQNLKLNDYERNEIQSEYRAFYLKTMELYQSSFDEVSVDYLKIISTSDKFYELEDHLILKILGTKALEKFQKKELERRANFYALLKYYSTHKDPKSNN